MPSETSKIQSDNKAIRAFTLSKRGHTTKSIADILGISMLAVKNRILLGERLSTLTEKELQERRTKK